MLTPGVVGAWERPFPLEWAALCARTRMLNFAVAAWAASGERPVTVRTMRVPAACLGTDIAARNSVFWPASSPPTAHVDRPRGWQTVKWGESLRGFADSWILAEPLCPALSHTQIA